MMNKPKMHNVKLNIWYADAVNDGIKPFEVRENDRLYQKGDLVRFTPVETRTGVEVNGKTYKYTVEVPHPVSEKTFEITYVMSGRGVSPEYVVLGIQEIEL